MDPGELISRNFLPELADFSPERQLAGEFERLLDPEADFFLIFRTVAGAERDSFIAQDNLGLGEGLQLKTSTLGNKNLGLGGQDIRVMLESHLYGLLKGQVVGGAGKAAWRLQKY
jgi:hypothetical protein